MKIKEISAKKTILINLGIIIILSIIIPLLLNLLEFEIRTLIFSFLGNFILTLIIFASFTDLIFLFVKKRNIVFLSFLNLSLSVSLFLLLEYLFLSDNFYFMYVWNYSESTLPIFYKIVAIWAGQGGSIMTWMVFNSIVISFYRIKNHDKEDLVFIRSVIISLIILIIFLIILLFTNVFKIEPHSSGLGLNPLLVSPFMFWHPFFTFIAYAIFLIPFTVTISEIITPRLKLQNSYQKAFSNYTMKFGWLVFTLSIGLGAYWAQISLTWGRYWGWDPVETVSLIPWFFSTAFFHSISFKKENKILVKINIVLIFLSIIFSTFITRGGGLNSLHAFTGNEQLIVFVSIIGSILFILSLYVIYNLLNIIFEEYRNTNLLFKYLSYLFLISLAFVCIFGLLIPPLSFVISDFFNTNPIYINTNYFVISSFVLAIGLAITLIFCSLQKYFKIKQIIMAIIVAITIQSIFSIIIFLILQIWINPAIIIYSIALFASIFNLLKTNYNKMNLKQFIGIHSKTIIHAGISLILIGTIIDPSITILLDIFYISGFFTLLLGIVPSLLVYFLKKKKST